LGELASCEQFANQTKEDTRMVWLIENQDNARRILRSIIERTMINLVVDFGILKTEYQPHKTPGADFAQLSHALQQMYRIINNKCLLSDMFCEIHNLSYH
jgi:hypothetical protein